MIAFRIPRRNRSRPPNPRGIVLIIVMVVVVMISLAGFGFVASMSNANKVVHLRGEQLQMEHAILSAEEFLKLYLSRPPSTSESTSASIAAGEEQWMRGIVVADEGVPHGRVRFTVMAPRYHESSSSTSSTWRYGLQRESGRLDLRTVLEWESRFAGAGQNALLALPGMTTSIADAILDWMDADRIPRPAGAEDDYYATLNPPYAPRNGIPDSLEELLLIKGVTRSLLFGDDTNQNHHLDLDETSLSSTPEFENREVDGEQFSPWAELLTIFGGERNQTRQGEVRIDLNQPNLSQLHSELVRSFDLQLANYVILCRQYIPNAGSGPSADLASLKVNFASPSRYLFRSPLDVLQSLVSIPVAKGAPRVIGSPVPVERKQLDVFLAKFCDRVTISNRPILRGQINLNLAPPEVLRAIPGFDKGLVDQIVAARTSTSKRELSNPDHSHDEHPCWLLTEGLVSLMKMKELFPYLTVGGDVYRGQIIAFSETSRLSQRVEMVLDASRRPVRRLFWKDLQILGRGYPWDVLDTPGGVSTTQPYGAFDATPAGN
jgi:type II secretory pathway component PulK